MLICFDVAMYFRILAMLFFCVGQLFLSRARIWPWSGNIGRHETNFSEAVSALSVPRVHGLILEGRAYVFNITRDVVWAWDWDYAVKIPAGPVSIMSQAPETVPFDGEGNCDFVALFSFHVLVLLSIKPDFWLHCSCYGYMNPRNKGMNSIHSVTNLLTKKLRIEWFCTTD